MPTYYLDTETTGLDPKTSKIITIQYQELDPFTGKPRGELTILKEWESNEKEILSKFMKDMLSDPYPFSFVSVGRNLRFDHNFLMERAKVNGMQLDILNRPFIDLNSILVMMNNGQFKGSSMTEMTGKKEHGSVIPSYYERKEYDRILDYIKNETEEFTRLLAWLYVELPALHGKFRKEFGLAIDLDKE